MVSTVVNLELIVYFADGMVDSGIVLLAVARGGVLVSISVVSSGVICRIFVSISVASVLAGVSVVCGNLVLMSVISTVLNGVTVVSCVEVASL